jgi:hypothetical protein
MLCKVVNNGRFFHKAGSLVQFIAVELVVGGWFSNSKLSDDKPLSRIISKHRYRIASSYSIPMSANVKQDVSIVTSLKYA